MQEVYQERYEKKNTNHLSNVTSNFLSVYGETITQES